MAKVDDFSRFLKKSDDKRGIIDENGVKTSKNESFDLERVRVGVEMMVNAVKNYMFFAFFESFLSVSENFSDVLSDLEKFLSVLRKNRKEGEIDNKLNENLDFKRISVLKVGESRDKCDFLIKNSIKTGVYEILLADEKCISEIKKMTDFDSKAHFIASKGEILSVFLSKLHKYCFGFNLWQEIKFIVKSASERKQNNVRLKYSHEAEKCLLNIRSLGEITNRGIDHIKDVANTAALLDQSDVIEFSHVVEAADCRLFDRNSWLSAYKDKSISEYNRDNGAILEPWTNTVNIP